MALHGEGPGSGKAQAVSRRRGAFHPRMFVEVNVAGHRGRAVERVTPQEHCKCLPLPLGFQDKAGMEVVLYQRGVFFGDQNGGAVDAPARLQS